MKRLLIVLFAMLFASTAWAVEIGDDGLHKAPWMRDTFKDLGEDLAEATAEGKRLMIIVEQRGCIYCQKMHEEVFVVPEIANYISENYSAAEAAVAHMPGAFGRWTTFNMLNWVVEEGYATDEPFQKYHARMLEVQLD